MPRIPREEDNLSKFPPINPKDTYLIGTIEVKKVFKPAHIEEELARIVELWVIAEKIAHKGLGK